jgi:hypothetical protein
MTPAARGPAMATNVSSRSEFYSECVRRACRGKLLLVEAIAGFLALVAIPFGLWLWPDSQGTMNWVPLAIFLAVLVGTIIVGLVAAPYSICGDLEVERNNLASKLDNRERRRAAIRKLWELRKTGVNIRNRTIAVATHPKWHRDYKSWIDEVLKNAEDVSYGLRAWLDTLDHVRLEPRLPAPVNKDHGHTRRNMSEVLSRLQEFLQTEMLHKDIQQIEIK